MWQHCRQINTQLHSNHFTSRVLSNWQWAHASFRKGWSSGIKVRIITSAWSTAHRTIQNKFNVSTCNVGFYVAALAKVAGSISDSNVVEDFTLPEGGGGRWGGAGLAGGAWGRGGGRRLGSVPWDVGAPGWKSTGGPVKKNVLVKPRNVRTCTIFPIQKKILYHFSFSNHNVQTRIKPCALFLQSNKHLQTLQTLFSCTQLWLSASDQRKEKHVS